MANPKTKSELLKAMADGYAKLNEQIAKMSQEKAEQPFGFTSDLKKCGVRWQYDRCLRDLLVPQELSQNGQDDCGEAPRYFIKRGQANVGRISQRNAPTC